jgi:hypothetical protein
MSRFGNGGETSNFPEGEAVPPFFRDAKKTIERLVSEVKAL